MCGFAGFLGDNHYGHAVLHEMGQAIQHRGPDDAGIWVDLDASVGLSFRRLSILDLSPAGHQPMESHRGRYVVVFNGEIYNHLEIREQLTRAGSAPDWRGHSDTETLLAGFDAWGVDETIVRTRGMFAIAVWDRQERTITLARDRLGEKPLYYGHHNNVFLFGSELKSLKAHPAFDAEIDRDALTLLLRHNYIPAPYSIYRGIRKLPPGTLVTISLSEGASSPRAYWDARSVIGDALAAPFAGTPQEAVDGLEAELRRSIEGQMIADVPLGAFLSGGVDSSTIVALMQQISRAPVRTFSIGFREDGYDEAVYARQVAQHLGTNHTELYVSPEAARDVIPLLPRIYCEPFADSSQIPTFLVSQLARQQVTVALSGDAGDELFAGYTRYLLSNQFWSKLSLLPAPVRGTLSDGIGRLSAQTWTRLLQPARLLWKNSVSGSAIGDRMVRGGEVLAARNHHELYKLLVSHWTEPGRVVRDAHEPSTMLAEAEHSPIAGDFIHEMMALDLMTYLPDDILVKVDRAAMANSLETRVPLLDHRVVEFAWRLPLAYKLRTGQSKWALRQVLYKYVPRELIERPKMGFGVPIDSWLRGPLRAWAEELLDEARLRREGFFEPAQIRKKWSEHVTGQRNWHYHLWDILVFQAWLEDRPSEASGFFQAPLQSATYWPEARASSA